MCGMVGMMRTREGADVCTIVCGCLQRCEGDDGVVRVRGMGWSVCVCLLYHMRYKLGGGWCGTTPVCFDDRISW